MNFTCCIWLLYNYMFRSINEEMMTNNLPLQVCTFCNEILSPPHSDAVILSDERQREGGGIWRFTQLWMWLPLTSDRIFFLFLFYFFGIVSRSFMRHCCHLMVYISTTVISCLDRRESQAVHLTNTYCLYVCGCILEMHG